MKILSLLMWVGQFGLSVLFPTVFFLLLGVWLQGKFALGAWVVILCGILGLMTSISTARSCLRSMRKAAEEVSGHRETPISFNDHS